MIDFRVILDLLIAYALAVPVGWERETHERSAGLRTFPLVAVASCGFVIVAMKALVAPDPQSRVIQGLIGGIGFIGAGTIIQRTRRRSVHGTATAATILVTGVIGISVAYHMYDIAVTLSLLSLFTLRLFQAWKRIHGEDPHWIDDDSK